jgi:hypothetical protein
MLGFAAGSFGLLGSCADLCERVCGDVAGTLGVYQSAPQAGVLRFVGPDLCSQPDRAQLGAAAGGLSFGELSSRIAGACQIGRNIQDLVAELQAREKLPEFGLPASQVVGELGPVGMLAVELRRNRFQGLVGIDVGSMRRWDVLRHVADQLPHRRR